MSSTTKEIENVSQLKSQLQTIIGNIKVLEELEGAAAATTGNLMQTEVVVQVIAQQTSSMLQELEQQTANKKGLLKRIKQVQRKRKINKLNNIKKKSNFRKAVEALEQKTTTAIDSPVTPTTSAAVAASKPHHQLRNYHVAQRQLRSLELLKMLHASRVNDVAATRRFASNLAGLRTVWNRILQENTPKRTREFKIEEQWSEVYFGCSVQSYYGAELKMNEFLNRRHTWDSYLTRSSKHGSSIPSGWVLPKSDADESWLQYSSK